MLLFPALALASPAERFPEAASALVPDEEWAIVAELVDAVGPGSPRACVGVEIVKGPGAPEHTVWIRELSAGGLPIEERRVKADERGRWRDDTAWTYSGRTVRRIMLQDGITAIDERSVRDGAGRPLRVRAERDLSWGTSRIRERWRYGAAGLPVAHVYDYREGPFHKVTRQDWDRDDLDRVTRFVEAVREGPDVWACQTVFSAEGDLWRGAQSCDGEPGDVWTVVYDAAGHEIERTVVQGEVVHHARWTRDPDGTVRALHREAPFVGTVDVVWHRDERGQVIAIDEVGSDYRILTVLSGPGCHDEPQPERGDVR